jgi:hypothetical protein
MNGGNLYLPCQFSKHVKGRDGGKLALNFEKSFCHRVGFLTGYRFYMQ